MIKSSKMMAQTYIPTHKLDYIKQQAKLMYPAFGDDTRVVVVAEDMFFCEWEPFIKQKDFVALYEVVTPDLDKFGVGYSFTYNTLVISHWTVYGGTERKQNHER